MTWKEKFLRFLKEEGVYSKWVYNIYEQHPTSDLIFWTRNLKAIFSEEYKCIEAINYAFYWAYTRQGCDFWAELDEKWRYECRNLVYKI